MHMDGINHRPAIDGGTRIALRIVAIVREHGLQHARLHEIVAGAARKGRQAALGGFRIDKDIRTVAAAIHRGTADLDEADRLALRYETGWLRQFHTAAPLHMRMRPPAGEILDAKAPGLAIGAVGNRQPLLRATRGVIRIIPVEALARGRAAQEIDQDSLAAYEVNALWEHVSKAIWPTAAATLRAEAGSAEHMALVS